MILLDGAMGTVLQKRGLRTGHIPELLNLINPDALWSIHRDYLSAGSRVIYANTFGANGRKLEGSGHTAEEIIRAGVAIAKGAAAGTQAKVALDIGPLGELLEPMGTLSFEAAYALFQEMAVAGEKAGADLCVIETMTDLSEARAALLAVKENTKLPVMVTMSFDETGRTFTGCTVASMAHTLTGLGANAIGLNCSLGPDSLAPLVRELCRHTSLPVIAKPNAGLPDPVTGEYSMSPAAFASAIVACADAGASIVGGCCGTGPEYIAMTARALAGRRPVSRAQAQVSCVCTPTRVCTLDGVRVIGERINPTGKKRFQQALEENDLDYILQAAVEQEDAGADILDVNVGHPGVDEAEMLPRVVKKLQSAVSLPLQLDSSNPEALEAALRVYNGKAAVNSVNGDPEVLMKVLPIVKKYGAAVVGLTLDKTGLPKTAAERVGIARRILEACQAFGIPKDDLWIDCLTLTVSAQQEQAKETLEAVRIVHEEMGLQTVLGVSNISFGLPNRPLLNQMFLSQALQSGLTLPIINPCLPEMMDAVAAYRLLSGEDRQCAAYVERFAHAAPVKTVSDSSLTLDEAIVRGLGSDAARLAREALQTTDGLKLVEERLIPALDRVGADYEAGRVFLPQLLSAAQAAQHVFEAVRASMDGQESVKKETILIATVQGDIHDIGKNIAKTVLANYGYHVIDLGRDVAPEAIAEAVQKHDVRLVGLSALMTTTLPAMEKTVQLLKALPHPPAVMAGGAVVTPEYAERLGAYYVRDARQDVEIARKVFA